MAEERMKVYQSPQAFEESRSKCKSIREPGYDVFNRFQASSAATLYASASVG